MPLLADIGRVLVPALVALIVPLVLGWLFRSAQAESIANAGQRTRTLSLPGKSRERVLHLKPTSSSSPRW